MTFIVSAMMIIAVLLIVGIAQRRIRWLRTLSANLLITHITICALLIGTELYFRSYADSGYPFTETLASQNWMRRYLTTNVEGFRDRDWTIEELQEREVIYSIGDSFAQGWGIDNPADRYSDVLAAQLGDEYAVVNLARIGTATGTQLSLLQDQIALHPEIQPDVVLWQYYLNDIEFAGFNIVGLFRPEFPPRPLIADESYLADFLYWQVARRTAVNPSGLTYWDFMYQAYDNSVVWDFHRQEIDALVEYVQSLDARLIVVIFPNLHDPVGSIPYVDRVAQAVEAHGETEILRLYDVAAAWEIEDLVVSTLDSHASVQLNHYVGELLYSEFFRDF